jgi:DNA repair protein RecN (Recombination protein N)
MLRELYIKNYALIDEMTLTFSDKLTVLSGETGAGKSIIVGALGLVLGDKARTSSIRSGLESCTVEARFEITSSHPVHRLIRERGVENGAFLVIRRVITRSGTSKCFVNGLQIGVRELQDITGQLIDIHGQHQHQSLLNVKNHLFLLDRYGKLEGELNRYQRSYRKMQEFRKRIRELTMDERERERRIDILKYSIQEIEQAALREGEAEELEQGYKLMRNYEKLASAASATHTLLHGNDSSALHMLERSVEELSPIAEYSPELTDMLSQLESAKIIVEESSYSLQRYMDGIEYEPEKIDRLLSRLEQIKNMKKKYGDSVSDIEAYRKKCEQELNSLESNEETIAKLEEQYAMELKNAQRFAVELSAQRRVAAKTLEESVMKELSFLSMGKARFDVGISYKELAVGEKDAAPHVIIKGKSYELMPDGLDRVEFMISTNVGEPLLPLKSIASGGELSRFMLAIKTVLGDVDPICTFVFDEIDAGIGGKVAWAVGNRLKELAESKQILCITHQAQIASRGSMNIRVDKVSRDGRTVTSVKHLGGRERVEEVARMISGKVISDAALRQALQMINEM